LVTESNAADRSGSLLFLFFIFALASAKMKNTQKGKTALLKALTVFDTQCVSL
jgi:hypothetical protein